MFNLNEIKWLAEELVQSINKLQKKVKETDINDPAHVVYENKLIVLVGIRSKLMIKLAAEKQREAAKTRSLRVLVVDDSEAVREVLHCYFLELGFEQVDMAADGMQAWRKIQLHNEKGDPYGLVISDWNMPNMSGIQLLHAIREDKQLFGTPIYLVTAVRDKEKILSAIKQGINGYLVKPVNYNHIRDKFSKYLKA